MLIAKHMISSVFTATCTDLSLTGGTIRYIPDPNSKRPGTMATYTCDDDHFLVGFHTRVCQYDLTWSGSPECRSE